jgi:hypothetical protein
LDGGVIAAAMSAPSGVWWRVAALIVGALAVEHSSGVVRRGDL